MLLMGTSTISMTIFNSFLYVYQRVELVQSQVEPIPTLGIDPRPGSIAAPKHVEAREAIRLSPSAEGIFNLKGASKWVCLKIVYPNKTNGFADHYPYFLWL